MVTLATVIGKEASLHSLLYVFCCPVGFYKCGLFKDRLFSAAPCLLLSMCPFIYSFVDTQLKDSVFFCWTLKCINNSTFNRVLMILLSTLLNFEHLQEVEKHLISSESCCFHALKALLLFSKVVATE